MTKHIKPEIYGNTVVFNVSFLLFSVFLSTPLCTRHVHRSLLTVFVFLQLLEVSTTGPLSGRCPPRWSRPRPARSTSTSQPLPPPPTRPRTRRLDRADGRRPTHRMLCRRIQFSHPAPTCPLLHHRHQPLTPTPTTRRPTCRSHHLPLLSPQSRPSRLLTARNVRSSSAGMRRRKLGWMRRGVFVF